MDVTAQSAHAQAQDGRLPVFLARPTAEGRYPAVVAVTEAFGLNDHIRAVATRIAAEGYVALAPDLYFRESKTAGYDDLPLRTPAAGY